ncbi:MAG: 4-hydroxy-tetrahydrodipicolinate reductase [Bdellovibrionaceae bacterium]|nr:4-hydroxy-tetrahydrodipicolinate reductase [Pseudobdellovibrionaceae bacterium]NUM60449.1 4-hydroxy-tetrahydrodipicolinate reductase [Pseudobdellovibrionaceae bacterium]
MNQIKIGVLGASGKVGKELLQVIKDKNHIPFLGIYSKNKPQDFVHYDQDVNCKLASEVDLWIDFSLPESFEKNILKIANYGKPIVSGTTGLTETQKSLIDDAAKLCPILWSSNMSLGIAVLNEALEALKKIKHFDFQIEEFHHNKKKDAPSGTAITLQENLEKTVDRKLPNPLSIRGGGIFGVHKVWAMSDQEVLCFEHQALNRRVFAEGALHVGLKLVGKPKGSYQIREIL